MDPLQQFLTTFFDIPSILQVLPQMFKVGLWNTIIISGVATVIGIAVGMVLAICGISKTKWLRVPARIYTDVFRGLPAVVTILIIGQGFAATSTAMFGPNPYPLGILSISLISAAYIGEVFRSGIESVDKGQLEASRALGMSYLLAMRLVVVPQGIRRVLPALMNQFIANVKDSSLVYFLGMLSSQRELFRVGQDAAVSSGNLSPLVLAGVFYLAITVPLTHVVNHFDHNTRAIRKRPTAPRSGLEEVTEMDAAQLESSRRGGVA